MQFIEPLIGAGGAILAAMLGAFVKEMLGRRYASDRRALELWRVAFDRSAFKGPYLWHSNQIKFREAIELTIKCVNTGILQNRQGIVLGKAKPKSQIKDTGWRKQGDIVERKLNKIRKLIPESGSLPEDLGISTVMDQERNEIIDLLNRVWKNADLPLLPLPTEVDTFDDVFQ